MSDPNGFPNGNGADNSAMNNGGTNGSAGWSNASGTGNANGTNGANPTNGMGNTGASGYTENPNGYGANYVNQPPAGAQPNAQQDTQPNAQQQYGQPYAYVPNQQPGQPGQPGQSGQSGQNPDDWASDFARADFDPFKLIEAMLPQTAKNWIRGIYAVVGVAALIIGIALLVWPGRTLIVATVALAIYFLISGIVRAVTAVAAQGLPSGWRVLDILVGILLTVGGIVVLKNTALSATTLLMLTTCMVGIGWIMEGMMGLVESWRVPSSGWAVAYGLLSIIAGAIVLVSPIESTTFLVVFAGCALVVTGAVALVRAFTFGRLKRSK